MKLLLLALIIVSEATAQTLWFEPNRGQAHPSVQFLAHTVAGYVYFNRTEFAVGEVRMDLVGGNKKGLADLEEPTGGISSYFIGRSEKDWHTGIPQYKRARFKEVYPGIDLVYYDSHQHLEYDFIVHSGGDPNRIQLAFNKPVEMTRDGDLLVGGLRQRRPKVYQGGREIACNYVPGEGSQVQFALAPYDHATTLTVDPVLDFSTYIGGPGYDEIADLKVDAAGFVYLAGASQTPQAPTLNPFQQSNIVALAPFVLKMSGDGQHVTYYALVGGNGWDDATGIVVDSGGNPTLVGRTRSSNFPLKNAFQSQFKAAYDNAFITRLSADGRAMVYSTYLGGSTWEYPYGGAAIDSSGNVWLAGYTESEDFPVKNPIQPKLNGPMDCFVAKISPTGALLFATYWGGSGLDNVLGLAVDTRDNVYLGGLTTSTDFPTRNALESTGSPKTGFASPILFKLSPDGQSVIFSTYLGNSASGLVQGISIDSAGNIYVTGEADDPLLHTTPGALQASSGGFSDAFLIKLDTSASKVLYSTYLGGSGNDIGHDIKVDENGYIYLAGSTTSPDFPVKNPLQQFRGGGPFNRDLFVAKISPSGSSLVYSTPFGGSGNEVPGRLALSTSGAVYVTGWTDSIDFPVKNAFQSAYGGGYDGVFARISDPTPIEPSPLTTSPAFLVFRDVQGSGPPAAQSLTIAGGAFAANANAPWLQVDSKGTAVSVSVKPANLNPGTYSGSVILTPTAGAPAAVPVTLTVLAPPPLLTSIDPPFVALGSDDTTITLHGSGFLPSSTIQVNGIAWLATPIQYVDSSTLKLALTSGQFTVSYTFAIAVQNPHSAISNTLALSVGLPTPVFTAGSVVNAGSFAGGPIAPGEIVTIFGANLAGIVTFDNIPATIVYTSATQISATVPYSVLGPKTSLQVGSSAPVSLDVAPSAPGIFAAVWNGDGTLTLYATGCGLLTQDAPPVCQLPVSATVNGESAQVLYAGIAPGLVQGANQINLAIPSDVTSGPVTIVLTAGTTSSKPFPYTLP